MVNELVAGPLAAGVIILLALSGYPVLRALSRLVSGNKTIGDMMSALFTAIGGISGAWIALSFIGYGALVYLGSFLLSLLLSFILGFLSRRPVKKEVVRENRKEDKKQEEKKVKEKRKYAKKKEEPEKVGVKYSEPVLIMELVEPDVPVKEERKVEEEGEEAPPIDRLAVFIEVVKSLRRAAGLPEEPVEKVEEKPAEVPKEELSKGEKPSLPLTSPSRPKPTTSVRKEERKTRGVPRERLVSVAAKKLERKLYILLESGLRDRGVTKYRDIARAKRELRKSINREELLKRAEEAVKEGKIDDTVLEKIALSIVKPYIERFSMEGTAPATTTEKRNEEREADEVMELLMKVESSSGEETVAAKEKKDKKELEDEELGELLKLLTE